MDTQLLSLILGVFGLIGIITLLTMTILVIWHYRGSRIGSFRWHWRTLRLKQLAALSCMFSLAMAASYAIIHDPWAILYILVAFKTGTWWLRCAVSQRI